MHSVFSLIRSQYAGSARSLGRTRTLTTAGILLAIQMVLSSYGVIEVSDSLKISLAHLALAPTAMLFGPIVAGMQGALSDILGFIIKPTGPYFPGFTLSAMLGGIVYGMMFYKTERRLWQVIAARLIIVVFVNIGLNTAFLVMLYGPAKLATLPLRAFKNIVQLPFDCVLLSAVCRLVRRVPVPADIR
ncbi:MAG: folate family ECF transporter S component [Clostridia bacterium]|nr:folate family ECF transporter S component [Clostridia bacterium]